MNNILSCLEGVRTVIIAGHTRPDGDCVGACMGLWHYLRDNYPEIEADVRLEPVPESYKVLSRLLAAMKMIRSMIYLLHWMPVTKGVLPERRNILIRQNTGSVLTIISAIRAMPMRI